MRFDISGILVRFNEEILLELRCMLDLMTEDELFCKQDMEELSLSQRYKHTSGLVP